jgi:peroxiredoxin (alkyl hydroperoxide reductase subunit C)
MLTFKPNYIYMKIQIFTVTSLLLLLNMAIAQQSSDEHFPVLGDQAPAFVGESTLGRINFPYDYFTKWKILFSHPADFTPVCSSEIIALASMQDDFEKLNTKILVLSTDGLNSHVDWCHSLESMKLDGYPQAKINFPLVSDVGLSISKKYGMIDQNSNSTKDVRAVFIIDPDNKISAIFYYPSNVGRNMEEIKRTLIALQTSDKYDILTPVNWQLGQDVMLHPPKSVEESKKMEKKATAGSNSDIYNRDWYMWYKRLP